MALNITFGDSTPGGAQSRIAAAIRGAAERRVQEHIAQFDQILKDEWVREINNAGLGTSRVGTAKERVTPIREAITGEFRKTTFPMVAEMVVAPDAKPKFDALSGQRGAHSIDARSGPNLIFPGTNQYTGRTIVVPHVNWRPQKGGFLLKPLLVLERAKRRWAREVTR